jgi:dsDNA-binding SOS-regulon protein
MKLKSVKHKFFAQPCQRGEQKFSSKLERSVYDQLVNLKESGKILFFLMQVPIHLSGGVRHLIDFFVATPTDCYFIEVKAASKKARAPIGEMKRKQAEEILGVEIHVVTDPIQVFGVIAQ